MKFIAKILVIIFFIINLNFLYAEFKIIITEIAPSESTETTDWIEFFVLDGTGNINGWTVYEGGSSIKIFGDINLNKGDYFVLNLKSSSLDSDIKNDAGYYDFYSTDTGLIATKNQIKICDSLGNVIDEMFFENTKGIYTDALYVYSIKKGESLARKYTEDIVPINTNSSQNDWELTTNQTKGYANKQKKSDLKILINEVSSNNTEADWIEFFVNEGEGNLEKFLILEGNTIVATLPSISVKKGDYFLLTFKSEDETNFFQDVNGVWNFYSSKTGLTATDSIVILRDNNLDIVDAFCYSNNDGTWTSSNQTIIKDLIKNNHWKSERNDELGCFVWTDYIKSIENKSFSRKYLQDGIPVDTNSIADWEVGKETKGIEKIVLVDDFDQTKVVDLQILNRHFSPYNDYKYKTIKIKYKNAENYILNIKIYDIGMHLVKKLLETTENGLNIIEWDGRNENNVILPVGVYVIFYEFVSKNTGNNYKGKKPVVLGKAL